MIDSYFKEIGLLDNPSEEKIWEQLFVQIGESGCRELSGIIDKRSGGQLDTQLYKHMNKTVEGSITFFGGFDSGFFRSLFQEIEVHKDEFGKEILDVGCNNGIITCFIAKCCPQAHVVGIDYEGDGILVARKIAEKLSLNNVEFYQKNFLKMKRNAFDTIFMFKVAHEIENFRTVDQYQPKEKVIADYKKKYSSIAKRVAMNLKDGGLLFSVERFPEKIITYGYCLALQEQGILPDMSMFKSIAFNSPAGREKMPFVYAVKKPGDDSEIVKCFEALLKK